jgi:SAM-dependent methyltransferase
MSSANALLKRVDVTADDEKYLFLSSIIKEPEAVKWENGVAVFPFRRHSPGLKANQTYFDQPEWRSQYLQHVHRSERFRSRWIKATGPWEGKIVVDIGCGPGNVAANLQQKARTLIGVDVSMGALEAAAEFGYMPIFADAQDLPLKSKCADIVIANAALHHCDDMAKVLAEAARLVAPGGILVTDHDPQLSAWDFRGLGLALWKSRLLFYRLLKRSYHRSTNEQSVVLESEIHHDAGDGVTRALFESVLTPLGFDIKLYPHNHDLGDEVFEGEWGRSEGKYRIAQMLSGIAPDRPEAALSIMCVARRNRVQSN